MDKSLVALICIIYTALISFSIKISLMIMRRKLTGFTFSDEVISNLGAYLAEFLRCSLTVFFSIVYIGTESKIFVDMVIYLTCLHFLFEIKKVKKKEMHIHHITVVLCTFILSFTLPNIRYSVYASLGLMEVTGIFLNIKNMLKTFKEAMVIADTHPIVNKLFSSKGVVNSLHKLSQILFPLTFVVLRIIYMTFLVLINIDLIVYGTFQCLFILVLLSLNYMWGLMLYKKYADVVNNIISISLV